MVPVVSVEKSVNPKSFIAYKCPSGQSRMFRSVLSPQFGFCSYNWVEYPCSGVESCDLVPNRVLAMSHLSVRGGQQDNYATYEKLFAEANGATDGANAEQQALSRAWDKYATVVVPFDERDCPNSVCAALPRPPPGKLVTVTATGHTFLGCAGYTASNRVGHKNSWLANVTNLDAVRTWVREKRSPLDVPGGIASDQPCMTIRAPGSRHKCKVHMGLARPLRVSTLCDNVIYIGTPMTDDGNRDVTGSFLILSVGAHSHPPPPITVATRGLLLTAREVAGHHHVTLAQEEEDVRQRLAEEYGRVAAAVPQTALRNARRQAVSEKNPWGLGRDGALRMVTRALAAGDTYFKTPIVGPTTGYIFPAYTDGAVRLVANGAVAIETDEYYKSVEALGLEQDGDFFVLALTATMNNRGLTLARFFIQRATRVVARTCYELFFKSVLEVNKTCAPWHVAVARQLRQLPVAADGDPEANITAATAAVRAMRTGVLIGIALDFSSTLAGGVCDALVAVGFDGFSVDEHASNILCGCAAHANRVCDRAPTSVRAWMRQLMSCHSLPEAARLRARVTQMEPGRDCSGVLANPRLLPAFCPAFSTARAVQRAAASSTTNVEESLHERVYKLCGRRQPLMVAMSGAKFVDTKDVDEMESGRAAGARTSVERGTLAERRKEARRQKRAGAGSGRDAPAAVDWVDSDNGHLEPSPPSARRPRKRKAVAAPAAEAAAAATVAARRILELENEVLQQRNRALMAELSAERVGRLQGVGTASADPPPTAHFGFDVPAVPAR
ncbi:hypothetical protein I4F81_005381 [Pyropia yezoensis]|uniref:Uncharacterized protein n=1 Tax=Pyropia yezoensis TaxID=2788 RepID=A0ACC3BY19_PYRYE|nr:hypothetical protein I4F81_005381 [Neopyropia yezoensis]